MASSSSAASAPIIKRLHVSGLIPAITQDHLRDRFNSFGSVERVEELGLDGNGQPRSFAYLTLRTTPAQLTKCLNIMSGAKWRGTTLKLAEAKRRYDWRLAAEQNPSEETLEKLAKRQERKNAKKRVRLGLGRESDSMKPVTLMQAEKRKFWEIDPGTSEADSEVRIIRPLCFRPLHPIPKPEIPYVAPTETGASAPAAKLSTKEQLKLKIKQARKERRKAPPPTRAQRRVLDPLAYGSRYRVFDGENEAPISEIQGGEWVFVSEEDDESVGVWKHFIDGDVVETERVVKRAVKDTRVKSEDDISVDLEGEEQEQEEVDELDALFAPAPVKAQTATRVGSTSPLFPERELAAEVQVESEASSSSSREHSQDAPSRSSSPLFPGREDRSASPLFPERSQDAASSRSGSPLFPQRQASPAISQRSASPLFPVRQAPAAPMLPPVKKAVVPTAAPVDEALVALARQERLAGLGVLSGLFDDHVEVDANAGETKKGKSEWRGFDESDDEDELQDVLRLRGGAGSSDDEDEDSSDESSEEESSDESSDEDSSEEESSEEEGTKMLVDEPETSKSSKLKDMFAPQPQQASGFSLMQNMDVELDDDVPFALTNQIPVANVAAPELELLAPSSQAVFDPDPSIPLFFPVGTKLTGAKGEAVDPMAEAREPGYKAFHQQETDAEMTARWDEQKLELTREYKRRHRDAVKQRRRRQGGAEAGETFD